MQEEEASQIRRREENDEKLNHKISQSIMQEANELSRDDLNMLTADGGEKAKFWKL